MDGGLTMALRTTSDAINDLPLFAAARRTDPVTSKLAAAGAREFAGDHARRILDALEAGPAGKTAIGHRCGLTEQQVARRMVELIRTGHVERTARMVPSGAGRPECEYRKQKRST